MSGIAAERPAPPARRALPSSPHCVRSAAGLSRTRHRTRANPGAPGGKKGRRGGREKEQEETPKGHNASAGIQRLLDLPALHFAAKRHQLERLLARPTRVFFFACERWHAFCSFIYLLFFPVCPADPVHPVSTSALHLLHNSSTFPSKKNKKSCSIEMQVLKNLIACISPRVYQNASSDASFQSFILILFGECFQSLQAQTASEWLVSELQSTSGAPERSETSGLRGKVAQLKPSRLLVTGAS